MVAECGELYVLERLSDVKDEYQKIRRSIEAQLYEISDERKFTATSRIRKEGITSYRPPAAGDLTPRRLR